jgi:ATP adenylyltransferase
MQETIQKCMRMLQATHEPSGFNIGLNQGTAGGASVTHLHFHIVPRYGKSASELNFMDILGTRVLVETLEQTLEKLAPHVKAFLGEIEHQRHP